MRFILTILGALLVLEGIPYFISPRKIKQWAAATQDVPEKHLRIIGFVTMMTGLLVLLIIILL